MKRPFHVKRWKPIGPLSGRGWWQVATELASLTDEEIHRHSVSVPPHHLDDGPTESDGVFSKAIGLGVNVGALWRALYMQWIEHDGYTSPFDTCTWEQALAYATTALGANAPEAARYEWAIRYMWCLELPDAQATP